ncbi:carbohydrate ABC transporter permease [Diplocloster agilis]|uniref:Sugar ABC transporter permease n=1 Tax=Diplocloster agilis TaxID=2850323 RepID=A0A949NE80_9FIRM|nr:MULTISPECIES: sugar ABC transporter permease [Lachnospiraceae]MBU9736861.1 sugar ABC transporter permease [Diplocloster agilis]MBU9743976.1 sugar ABC transporter permease [Diplocloster agilis]MCU6733716.1 sugar ABC transporter permease [Suonthocola fibrivorans]SCJ04793.1 Inner membrane ABC transporter permease protein ycjO [uncultured Clostridium sp.]
MINKKIYHWGFSLPAIVLYSLLFILPVTLNFYYSLTDWNAIKITGEVAHFIGFDNFKKIFSNPELTSVITRTVEFGLVTTVLKNVIGFTLALLFNEGLKSRHALRAVYFMPSMLSPLIIGLIFGSLLMTSGFFNQLLGAVGLENLVKPWLTTSGSAFGSVMFVEVWRQTGFNMVIYLAGLQLIDQSFYEAASIDGATAFQKLRYITLPRMLPSISINLLLNLSQGLKAFDIVYVLTGGGPNGSTELINTMVFKEFGKRMYGMSSAYGVVMFIITAVFGLIALKLTNKDFDS